jgi:hypothetical protein
MSDKAVWFITGAGRGMGVDIAQAPTPSQPLSRRPTSCSRRSMPTAICRRLSRSSNPSSPAPPN